MKIRVLQVVSNLNCGGAETMIMNIYRNIDKNDFQFDFLCINNINGIYEDKIRKMGGIIYKANGPRSIKQIWDIIKNGKYDVVHSHVMFYSGVIMYLAKKAKVKTRITHSHSSSDTKALNFIRKVYIKLNRFLINHYSTFKYACGEKAGQYLFGKNGNFKILQNGIDIQKFQTVPIEKQEKLKFECNIKSDELVIGHVGGFRKEKNQIYFIDLAKEMISENIKFKIILVGGGETFNDILARIKSEKLDNYFILPGKRDDVNVFMNIFDVFVMPSLYEGFPLVVVEALAANNICFLSSNISKETAVIKSRVIFFDLEMKKKDLVKIIIDKNNNKDSINPITELENKGFSDVKMSNDISNVYKNKIIK